MHVGMYVLTVYLPYFILAIQHKYSDWKDYLVKRLTGSRTLPSNFYSKVQEGINNHKFRKTMQVEVVNRMCVSAMRVATVEEVIGGRLRLKYSDSKVNLGFVLFDTVMCLE